MLTLKANVKEDTGNLEEAGISVENMHTESKKISWKEKQFSGYIWIFIFWQCWQDVNIMKCISQGSLTYPPARRLREGIGMILTLESMRLSSESDGCLDPFSFLKRMMMMMSSWYLRENTFRNIKCNMTKI